MASFVVPEPLAGRQLLESALAEVRRSGDLCASTRGLLLAVASHVSMPRDDARRPYARRTLMSESAGEIMLARRSLRVACAPHDHGGSAGVVLVVAGQLQERSYDFDERRLLERSRALRVAGSMIRVSPTSIHDMECVSEDGWTLHLYAPAPRPMRLYDIAHRATVIVGEGEGAWLPAEQPLAVSRWIE